MPITLKQIQKEAFALSRPEKEKLIATILKTFQKDELSNAELIWLLDAKKRFKAIQAESKRRKKLKK